MPNCELGSNKRCHTVLCNHEIVQLQLLIVLTNKHHPYIDSTTVLLSDICNLWDNCVNMSVYCFVLCSWCFVHVLPIVGGPNHGVWSLPKVHESVGCYKWTPATTSILVLSAIWYYKGNTMYMHTARGKRTQQSSHAHFGCCGGG